MATPDYQIGTGTGETLKSFQLDPNSGKKTDWEYGKALLKYICNTTFAGIGNGYFWLRNARFKQNRDMAAGKMNTSKFQDRLQMNGKTNYVNINWQSLKIINTIISKMVGRWMSRSEKISVTATDPLSIKDKEEEYKQAEFILNHRKELEQLQQQSGVKMIPDNQFVASNREELLLWRSEYLRLPEEILHEIGCNDILAANGFDGANKEKLCHDSAEVGFVGTYTWMDDTGSIYVEWVKPENAFYSYSEYNDLRDTTWRGRVIGMKISEIRRRYGKEFGGFLTEEQLFDIAQKAKEYQQYDKLRWLVEWNVTILRPYDEWNVDVVECEIKSVDSDPYTIIQTKTNKSTLVKKGKPDKLADNEEYVEDTHINIYRGLYIRDLDIMLEWGIKKNMIRPNDPKELGNAEFSYSYYMYQNQDMKNVAVPEKVQRPAEQMIIACFKMEQLVATMRPPGAAINEDALQEIDYGLGDSTHKVDYKKQYDQTGTIYYRGRDAEGNPIPLPITELANTGFQPAMMALIQDYQFHYQVLKDELGEDPNLVTQAAQPRVTEGNVQTSLQQAEFATDYMYDAVMYVLEDTAKKISCLLHKSIEFGAKAYRDIMGEEDIKGRVFDTRIRELPTESDMARLDAFMNQAMQSNPQLIQFLDPFLATRMAKEDVKLAEVYIRQCQKKMLEWEAQQAQQNQQATFQAQQAAAQQNIQAQQALEQFKAQYEQQKTADLSRADKEKILLTGFTTMWAAGTVVPSELKGLEAEIIKNIAMPLFAENQSNQAALIQAAQMNAQSAQQPEQQPQDNIQEQQPQQAA